MHRGSLLCLQAKPCTCPYLQAKPCSHHLDLCHFARSPIASYY
uniref:Uncharacterized protein n=1 Tax=Arundo donax TaxID=35708 RepID=A0A0A9CLJ5_ARUDO